MINKSNCFKEAFAKLAEKLSTLQNLTDENREMLQEFSDQIVNDVTEAEDKAFEATPPATEIKWINQNLNKPGSWMSEQARALKGIMFRQREMTGGTYTKRIKVCVKGSPSLITNQNELRKIIAEKLVTQVATFDSSREDAKDKEYAIA